MKINVESGQIKFNDEIVLNQGMSLEDFEKMLPSSTLRLKLADDTKNIVDFHLENVSTNILCEKIDLDICFVNKIIKNIHVREHVTKAKKNDNQLWNEDVLAKFHIKNENYFQNHIEGETNKFGFYSFFWGRIALEFDSVKIDSYIEIDYNQNF